MRTLTKNDSLYPVLLKEIPNGPDPLYVLGDLPGDDFPKIAIVGTRKATQNGIALAREIGEELARAGAVVVSGLALGIDAAAHEGALRGEGRTIGVLARGLDAFYPASNEGLAKRICKNGGAIVSEYEPETPAYPNQFLERNRIISGLSLAVVIVEAPARSGTLVTAKHALDQGREVFVCPGPHNHPNYAGSHMLIRNGARLVRNAEDVLEDLDIQHTATCESADESERKILSAIKSLSSATLDTIVEKVHIEPHIVNQKITFLMIEGIIEEREGKFCIP